MTSTIRQSRNSRFQRGSGAFACESCGRMTRSTGVQSHGSRCCEQCYELAGIENGISDGSPQSDYQKAIDAYANELLAKGVSLDTIIKAHDWIIDWSKFTPAAPEGLKDLLQLSPKPSRKAQKAAPAPGAVPAYTVHTSAQYWNSPAARPHLAKLAAANEARRAAKLARKGKK